DAPRRLAYQRRYGIGGGGQVGLEQRNARRRLRPLAARLFDVEAGDQSRLEPPAGNLEVIVLKGQRIARNGELQRRGARLNRRERDLPGNQPLEVGERIARGG